LVTVGFQGGALDLVQAIIAGNSPALRVPDIQAAV
jgi:hypothetical protein